MNEAFKWVTCDGGPHLLLPLELVPLWHGCDPELDMEPLPAVLPGSPAPLEFATHYDLARAIDGLIGLIPVAAGFGLVLDDEVCASTWFPSARFSGGYIVIHVAAPAGFDGYRAAAESLPEAAFRTTGLSLTSSGSGFLLFAAAETPSDWNCPTVEAPCPRGTYIISTAELETEELILRIHRLKTQIGLTVHSSKRFSARY